MNSVYMTVTKDEYELPVIVANTRRDMAKALGISYGSVSSGISRGRVLKVMIPETDEEEALMDLMYKRR